MKMTLLKIKTKTYCNLIFAFIVLLILNQCNSETANSNNKYINKSGEINYDKILSDIVNECNKKCPILLDKETQWDNAIYLSSPYIFQYNYSLFNMEKTGVDTAALIGYLTPRLINNARTNPDMKAFLESKVNLSYVYKDKNGEYLFKVFITPQLYEN